MQATRGNINVKGVEFRSSMSLKGTYRFIRDLDTVRVIQVPGFFYKLHCLGNPSSSPNLTPTDRVYLQTQHIMREDYYITFHDLEANKMTESRYMRYSTRHLLLCHRMRNRYQRGILGLPIGRFGRVNYTSISQL